MRQNNENHTHTTHTLPTIIKEAFKHVKGKYDANYKIEKKFF